MAHIFVSSDHGGFEAKKKVLDALESLECTYEDLGPSNYNPDDDYPRYSKYLCEKVLENKDSKGILICGSGVGVAIAANKIEGIRAVQGYDIYTAKMARLDEDANVLTLRAREFDTNRYYEIIKSFLETEFSQEERHIRRINELETK